MSPPGHVKDPDMEPPLSERLSVVLTWEVADRPFQVPDTDCDLLLGDEVVVDDCDPLPVDEVVVDDCDPLSESDFLSSS